MENVQKRDFKAVVVDLDGTLLNENHSLSDRNRDTLKKVMALGIKVILATGKTRTSAEPIISALNLDTPGVFVQGLMICNPDGTIRHQQKMPPAAARRVIQYAEDNGFEVIAYSGNRLLAKHTDENVTEITKYGEPMPQAVGPLVNHVDHTVINKLIIVGGSPRKLKAIRWQLNQQIGTQVSFTSAAVLTSLEVLPKGGSKANGVRVVLKELGINPEDVLAIGDAENDIDMLKMVGFGVAMGNADASVKEAANAVVGSNAEDGVAEALEKFILPEEKAEPIESDAAEQAVETTANTSEESDQTEGAKE